jgi:hypothetical protein
MSIKNGFNFANINEFCEKYKCKLLTKENELNFKTKILNIISSCGHTSTVTFNNFLAYKKGVYCADCFEDILGNVTNCLKCGVEFIATKRNFCFCSKECSHSRKVTDAHKAKSSKSQLNKHDIYKDEDGNLKSFEEIKQIRTERVVEKVKDKKIADGTLGNTSRSSYENIKAAFENNGCKFLTTQEEYNKVTEKICPTHAMYKIIAKCGHTVENANYGTFVYSKSNFLCKTCTLKNVIIKNKNNSKIDNVLASNITEKNGITFLESSLKSFNLEITKETCTPDILIKPKSVKENMWLPIQLKITNKPVESTEGYSFNIRKDYKRMLLLLVCLSDKKMWLFDDGNNPSTKSKKITIGKEKSKYKKYEINLENIDDVMKIWYDSKKYNIPFEIGNSPTTHTATLERKFSDNREKIITFLNFVRPPMNGMVYDFLINNKKIQEKVCKVIKSKTNSAAIAKAGGRITSKKGKKMVNKVPYEEGDNDFYWIHERNTNFFYVIPEGELIKQKFIKTKTQDGLIVFNTNKQQPWLGPYKFSYITINTPNEKNRLLKLLNLPNEEKPQKINKPNLVKYESSESENSSSEESEEEIIVPKKIIKKKPNNQTTL